MSGEADTLGDALPREMKRVREEVLPLYQSLLNTPGVEVRPAIAMMNADLTAAEQALARGDVVEMLRVYQSLKETTG